MKKEKKDIKKLGTPKKVEKQPISNKPNLVKRQKTQLIDDVYDENVVFEGHTLYTLREGNVLQYIALLDCSTEFTSPYIQKRDQNEDSDDEDKKNICVPNMQ